MEVDMSPDVGTADRAIRIVLGCVLIALALFGANVPFSGLGWIGIVPLLTAFAGTCPLYSMLGIGTCPAEKTRR
jgi:hypothetical protein